LSGVRHTAKYGILTVLLLVLFNPGLQDSFELKKWIKPLNGSFTNAKDTSFSWPGWFSGGYQAQKEKFLRDSFGLRNYYVKLNSQVNYNLFKKANAVYVIVGEDNYLYETGYFDAFFGKDFIGRERLDSLLFMLKDVQQKARKSGKLIIPVFAPGKASYYPEYIPAGYRSDHKLSNYLYLAAACKARKIDHIDFNRYFIERKYISKYPLYPQFGIHWSNYGALMSFDSILRYTEAKLNIDLPDVLFRKINLSRKLQNTDDDIIKGMNLLIEPRTFEMAYPEWEVRSDSLKHARKRLLVMADSFWWYIYSTSLPTAVFSKDNFWFYNEVVYPESFTRPTFVKDIDYKKAIRDADVILILHSESTLSRFGCGFIQMMSEAYSTQGEVK
jgi:hypothetical protein